MTGPTFPQPIPEDQVPLQLTPAEIAKLKNLTRKTAEGLASLIWFLEQAEEGSAEFMTREAARGVMNTAERRLATLGQLLGVDTEAAQRIEERHANLRYAHGRIRELEAQLGQVLPAEGLMLRLRALAEKLDDWWDCEGFGYVGDLSFNGYNASAEFGMRFTGCKPWVPGAEDKSPAERRTLWLADLQRRGFVLNDDDGKGVTDCPESRAAVRALFEQRFPEGHRITHFVSSEARGRSTLTGVKVRLTRLQQILDLPELPPGAADLDPDL